MLKKLSIRIKLLIMIIAVLAPIVASRVIYVLTRHNHIIGTLAEYKNLIEETHRHYLWVELAIFGIAALISSVIALVFANKLLKPVKVLRNTAKKIMEGDYSARTEIVGNDEIGMTAEAFDKMAESIENWGKNSLGVIASLSHEIKTPLNVIFSSVQLIDSYKNTLDCQNYKNKIPIQINIIRQNCYRLMRLTSNLLDICRHDSGYLKAKFTNYDIVKLAEEITLSVKRYAESKGIDLVFESDMAEKTISCDPDMIERILLNLISNAIKFTDKNGTIAVKLTNQNDNIVLTVKDTGIGISKNKLNKIFELFNHDDNYIRNKEGSGIGLYLVKALAEAHGGKIQVNSEESVGSEFYVSLPSKVLSQTVYPSLKEIQSNYKNNSYNGVQRVNIEFSDIYSCFNREISTETSPEISK